MNVLALDLEMNQPSRKIIEIGVAVGNAQTLEIYDRKSFLVNPLEELNPEIIKLCRISQNMVDTAPVLLESYKAMVEWVSTFNVHPMPVVWGSGDVPTLGDQMIQQYKGEYNWIFGRTEMNVKNIVQAHRMALGFNTQGGLAKSLKKYDINFNGTKHRAHDDAYNTLVIYFEFLKRMKTL